MGLNPDMPTVLVVDDEPIVREVVCSYLQREGYRTLEAADGDRARELLESSSPALVVLDLMLPGRMASSSAAGSAALRAPRDHAHSPRRGGRPDRGAGARGDDYVTKPFSPRELVARVRTVLRRAGPHATGGERLAVDDLVIDQRTREVSKGGRELKLTAKEFDLLWFLARHPRQVFSRDQLMDRVWGYTSALDTGTVTVHVRRLREKIEDDPALPAILQTVWGVGYRFSSPQPGDRESGGTVP